MTTEARIAELEALLETTRCRAEEETARAIRAEEKMKALAIEASIRDAAARSKVPVAPAALADIVRRATQAGDWQELPGRGMVRMDSGLPALDSTGKDLTAARWLEQLAGEAPHLFSGGDTRTLSDPAGENPFRKDSWDMTKQGLLYRQDPARAKALAAAAGIKLEG